MTRWRQLWMGPCLLGIALSGTLSLALSNTESASSSGSGSTSSSSSAASAIDIDGDTEWAAPSAPTSSDHGSSLTENSECATPYRRLFSKGTVNVRVVFGYKDARPARFVGDRHERIAFIQRLLLPCTPGSNGACGFERSHENSDLLLKTFEGFDHKQVRFRVWVVNSSVSSDDEANRSDPFQNWQSVYARSAFYTGLHDTDIVFYNGHSRFGGGPDFEPPRLAQGGDVDAYYYQMQQPGETRLKEVLKNQDKSSSASGIGSNSEKGKSRTSDHANDPSPSQLKILGLFSCSSSQHFTDDIRQFSKVALISSRNLVYYADALDNSVAALNSIIEMKCLRDFNSSLQIDKPAKGMSIQGWFVK